MQQSYGHTVLTDLEALFITGTDTSVGKTAVSAALAAAAERAGRPWAYFKPAESGADSDAGYVASISGRPDRVTACYRLAAPLAPQFAAESEGRAIDLAVLDAEVESRRGARPLIVEGAGGALVPYAPGVLGADLAARWRLPALVVVANRLGCLNHALLTIEALERRGVSIAGVVFNEYGDDLSTARNVADFRRLSTVPVLATLRRLRAGEKPSADWWHQGVVKAS